MSLGRPSLADDLRAAVAGSVVMVTGASSGIGAATALRMGAAGAKVLLVARSTDGLQTVQRQIEALGGTASSLPTDLCDRSSTKALIDEVERDHGGVDVLISNAGKSIRRLIDDSYDRLQDFERTIDVNYIGPVQLVLGLLPAMRARRAGHIVNVSSLGVLFCAPRFAAYLGSKSAFDAFLRCVAPEVKADGVAVTNVYLPLVRTPMSEPIQSWGSMPHLTPDEAAERICTAVIKRPPTVAPRFAKAGRVAQALAPSAYDSLLRWAYRSPKQHGDDVHADGDRDVEAPGIQSALELMGRARAWGRARLRNGG